MSSGKLFTPQKAVHQHKKRKDEEISALEAELEKVNLELWTVRNERDKQRQQLASLTEEFNQLSHQKEQRIKRSQLSSQLQDLTKSLKRKTSKKLRAIEDLEQVKSRHRQLLKTVDLLQGGVQTILSKSYFFDQRDSNTDEGKLRTQQRQQLLKGLLSEELKTKMLTSSLSTLNINVHDPRQNDRWDDEDDEINDKAEEVPTISLFADKNKRLDSANSEVSSNDYLVHANTTYRVPSIAAASISDINNNHSGRSRSRKSRSKDRSASGRRSPSNGSSSRRNRSNSRDRSNRSSNSQGKSQSRRGRRPNSSRQLSERNILEEEEHDTIDHSSSVSKKSGLASMLESSRSGHDSDDPSDDTPKTANTNG
jgi:hypothetical protein